ncbi:helix-turn-helix domain-containing protein [Syntrophomonas curvata]
MGPGLLIPMCWGIGESIRWLGMLRKNRKDILLNKYGGNISQVAKTMRISRNTVYRKMKKYKFGL